MPKPFPVTVRAKYVITPNGRDTPVNLPTKYVICSTCSGEGKSSAHLGCITQEEQDWHPDEFEGYLRGDYDKPCLVCDGSGKEVIIDRQACRSPQERAGLRAHDRQMADDRHFFAMVASERRYGA